MTALHVPAWGPDARSVFHKLGGRRYLVISITMVAVVVEVGDDRRVVRAGIAVGSCSAVARRLAALESRLVGCHASALADCIEADDLSVLAPIDDVRASAGYRIDATRTLLRRALAGMAP